AADVTEAELTPRKAVLIGGFGRSLETSSGIVGRLSMLALYGLPLAEINKYISGVQAITAADVKKFAGSSLAPTGTSLVIVGNAKAFLEPLKQRFPNVEVIPYEELDLAKPALKK
ncbi:MAG TPA: insulinase family protein, partial [Thermoanaerobaculia bacterium]